jgi:hypothetical protein
MEATVAGFKFGAAVLFIHWAPGWRTGLGELADLCLFYVVPVLCVLNMFEPLIGPSFLCLAMFAVVGDSYGILTTNFLYYQWVENLDPICIYLLLPCITLVTLRRCAPISIKYVIWKRLGLSSRRVRRFLYLPWRPPQTPWFMFPEDPPSTPLDVLHESPWSERFISNFTCVLLPTLYFYHVLPLAMRGSRRYLPLVVRGALPTQRALVPGLIVQRGLAENHQQHLEGPIAYLKEHPEIAALFTFACVMVPYLFPGEAAKGHHADWGMRPDDGPHSKTERLGAFMLHLYFAALTVWAPQATHAVAIATVQAILCTEHCLFPCKWMNETERHALRLLEDMGRRPRAEAEDAMPAALAAPAAPAAPPPARTRAGGLTPVQLEASIHSQQTHLLKACFAHRPWPLPCRGDHHRQHAHGGASTSASADPDSSTRAHSTFGKEFPEECAICLEPMQPVDKTFEAPARYELEELAAPFTNPSMELVVIHAPAPVAVADTGHVSSCSRRAGKGTGTATGEDNDNDKDKDEGAGAGGRGRAAPPATPASASASGSRFLSDAEALAAALELHRRADAATAAAVAAGGWVETKRVAQWNIHNAVRERITDEVRKRWAQPRTPPAGASAGAGAGARASARAGTGDWKADIDRGWTDIQAAWSVAKVDPTLEAADRAIMQLQKHPVASFLFRRPMWASHLRCGHVFHEACAFKWLSKNQCCPICKHDLSVPASQFASASGSSSGASQCQGGAGAGGQTYDAVDVVVLQRWLLMRRSQDARRRREDREERQLAWREDLFSLAQVHV